MPPVNEFRTVFGAVMPVFGVMVIGFFLRRRAWLTASAEHSLLQICINLLLPALIFDSVLGNPALRRPENLVLPPLVGFSMVAAGFGIALLAGRLAGLPPGPERRTFGFTTGLQNYSYLTIPLSMMLFDPATTGVLFIHNVGVEATMWTLGLIVMTGEMPAGGWRKLFNAPVLALLLGVALNELGLFLTPPAVIQYPAQILLTTLHWLGQCAIPMALLLIGAIIADNLGASQGRGAVRVVATALIVRLGIMPLLFVLVARHLPCSLEFKRVLVLQGAMPSAVLPIALAKHYQGDTRVALQVVLGTSLAGLLTVPLWIRFGGHLAGLW